VKPYARIPGFIIGVVSGCTYYSYKMDDQELNRVAYAFDKVRKSNIVAAIWIVFGIFFQVLMVLLMQVINN
jgi:hypothetical protein